MIPEKHLDDYQVESRNALFENLLWCLFDEPGVGKTGPAITAGWGVSQAIGVPVVVTCPAYLIDNWEREIHAFIPFATVARADGSGQEARQSTFERTDADFILTSYNNWGAKVTDKKADDYGQYKYKILVDRKWAAYIFDEGHRLRGRKSSWTKHVFRTRLATSRNLLTPLWFLTGTPFVRDGGDFWPYFKLYDPKKYSSYWRFVDDWCVVTKTPWSTKVGNIRKSRLEEFRAELAKFSMRRTVKDVPQLADLEFEEHNYWVDLPVSVVKMIQKAKKSYVLEHPDLERSEFLKGSGALYVAQRQIATVPPTKQNPKMDWLLDFLSDRRDKVVVYTWYKQSATTIVDALGSKAVLVTGDVPVQRRNSVIDRWKDLDGPQTLVATIPSLKEGISLTEASDVVFLEHSELPADIEQCIKRLCRRGQEKVVQVHHVWAKKSVEEAIEETLTNRAMGFSQAMAKWIKDV